MDIVNNAEKNDPFMDRVGKRGIGEVKKIFTF